VKGGFSCSQRPRLASGDCRDSSGPSPSAGSRHGLSLDLAVCAGGTFAFPGEPSVQAFTDLPAVYEQAERRTLPLPSEALLHWTRRRAVACRSRWGAIASLRVTRCRRLRLGRARDAGTPVEASPSCCAPSRAAARADFRSVRFAASGRGAGSAPTCSGPILRSCTSSRKGRQARGLLLYPAPFPSCTLSPFSGSRGPAACGFLRRGAAVAIDVQLVDYLMCMVARGR